MTAEQNREEDQSTTSSPAVGLSGIVKQHRKIREHAETYPYVLFMVVLPSTYRWRKLHKTEDRVRALQKRLRKLVETVGTAGKTSQSADKTSK